MRSKPFLYALLTFLLSFATFSWAISSLQDNRRSQATAHAESVEALVARTIDAIKELKEKYQLTVLMAEQNFTQAVRIADRGYVIVHGRIAVEGRSANELNNNDLIRKFYLGL